MPDVCLNQRTPASEPAERRAFSPFLPVNSLPFHRDGAGARRVTLPANRLTDHELYFSIRCALESVTPSRRRRPPVPFQAGSGAIPHPSARDSARVAPKEEDS